MFSLLAEEEEEEEEEETDLKSFLSVNPSDMVEASFLVGLSENNVDLFWQVKMSFIFNIYITYFSLYPIYFSTLIGNNKMKRIP